MRTTHRSTNGTKLYAVRSKAGKFTDIQTHKRASAADQRKRSKAEGTWVRWGLLHKNLGIELFNSHPAARSWLAVTPGARIVRIEIHAGCPDPLRKRR